MSSRGASGTRTTGSSVAAARARVEGRHAMTAAEKGYKADRARAAVSRAQHGNEKMTELMRDSQVPGVGKRAYTQAQLEGDLRVTRATAGILTGYRDAIDRWGRGATGQRAEQVTALRGEVISRLTAYARQTDNLEQRQAAGNFKAGPGYQQTPLKDQTTAHLQENLARNGLLSSLERRLSDAGIQSASHGLGVLPGAHIRDELASRATRGGGKSGKTGTAGTRTAGAGKSTKTPDELAANRAASAQKAAATRAANKAAKGQSSIPTVMARMTAAQRETNVHGTDAWTGAAFQRESTRYQRGDLSAPKLLAIGARDSRNTRESRALSNNATFQVWLHYGPGADLAGAAKTAADQQMRDLNRAVIEAKALAPRRSRSAG
jgi:hypothetical protein